MSTNILPPNFNITKGQFSTSTDGNLNYALYTPKEQFPEASLPFVVLLHGFGGNLKHLSGHAERLAAKNIICLCPSMASLLKGGIAQVNNIKILAQEVKMILKTRPEVDARRIALVGHSAGGAVTFETVKLLQYQGVNVLVWMGLDAVPWSRTIDAAKIFPVNGRFIHLYAEPSTWNKRYAWRKVWLNLPAQVKKQRILICGSRHGDPIDPWESKGFMNLLGLRSKDTTIPEIYSTLLYNYLVDVLLGENLWDDTIRQLTLEGKIIPS